ncbi:MAG: RDD family protein [Candidatus Bathyarchaeota archaeon]
MSRCQYCGEYNGDQDQYCFNCGRQLVYTVSQDGLDILVRDFKIQSFWALRLFAYIIDAFIIAVFGFTLSVFAYFPLLIGSLFGSDWAWKGVWAAPFYLGLAQVVYSIITEYVYGATFGKQIIGLKVINRRENNPGIVAVTIRNLSKAHWVLVLFDFLGGVLSSVDPRDKYMDRVSGTYVAYSGSGIRIPFVSRPYTRREHRREIIPVDLLPTFDPVSALNIGVLFVVVATIIMNTPSLPAESMGWVISFARIGLHEPPANLLTAFYWFLMTMGVWGILSGVARYVLKLYPLKAVRDIVNGAAGLGLGVLLRNVPVTRDGLMIYLSAMLIFFVLQLFFFLYLGRRVQVSPR